MSKVFDYVTMRRDDLHELRLCRNKNHLDELENEKFSVLAFCNNMECPADEKRIVINNHFHHASISMFIKSYSDTFFGTYHGIRVFCGYLLESHLSF